ncbi:MAG: hypothetical protein ACK4OO_03190 [bacterium]
MKTKVLISIIILLGFVELPWAATPGLGIRSWLRGSGGEIPLSKFYPTNIQHHFSVGYVQGEGGSLMQSLYATTLTYYPLSSLTFQILMGVENTRLNGSFAPSGSVSSLIGGAALEYRPNDNFSFRFEFRGNPGLTPYNQPFGAPGYRIETLGRSAGLGIDDH